MKRPSMNRHRNHVGQLGRLTVCDTRSGATRVHGGEHGSGFLGLKCRGTLAADEFGPNALPAIRDRLPAAHLSVGENLNLSGNFGAWPDPFFWIRVMRCACQLPQVLDRRVAARGESLALRL